MIMIKLGVQRLDAGWMLAPHEGTTGTETDTAVALPTFASSLNASVVLLVVQPSQ